MRQKGREDDLRITILDLRLVFRLTLTEFGRKNYKKVNPLNFISGLYSFVLRKLYFVISNDAGADAAHSFSQILLH